MSAAHPETLTIERRLTSAQAERRDRVREAARALAEAGGYAAVTMDAVAERSGVARATIYRYFASKDHLLAEVAVDWGREIAARLQSDPPSGATTAARVASCLRQVLEAAFARPRLTAAVVASAISSEPEAVRAQQRFTSVIPGLLDVAIADAAVARRADIEGLIGHVLFSVLVNATSGRIDADEAMDRLQTAAELLFREEIR